MSTKSQPRKIFARVIAGTVLAVTGSAALAMPAQAIGLNDHGNWKDGGVGANIGCTIARATVNPNVCAGMFGLPLPSR